MDDEFLNLLDYDEEDLNGDLHRIFADTNTKSKEIQVAGEAVEDLRNHLDSMHKIEFFFSSTGHMLCPIDGCSTGQFHSKGKYMRHWTEKHVPTSLKYNCSIRGCNVSCRRRYDMKVHVREVHRERYHIRIEDLVSRCEKVVMTNRGFIDPGFWIYKGRTGHTTSTTSNVSASVSSTVSSSFSSSASTVSAASVTVSSSSVSVSAPSSIVSSSSVMSSSSSATCIVSTVPDVATVISTILATPEETLPGDNTDFSVHVPAESPVGLTSLSSQKISLQDYRLREKTDPALSDVRHIDHSVSFGIKATTDGSCQTSCLEYTPLTLPPIPEQQDELEAYIRWLCLGMDQLGRQREAAKQKLEEMKQEGERFEKERKIRRELEADNRRLMREVNEAKWREKYLIPEL